MQRELSHIVHGHTTDEKLAEYCNHRGIFELEAEGSAYLIMNELAGRSVRRRREPAPHPAVAKGVTSQMRIVSAARSALLIA